MSSSKGVPPTGSGHSAEPEPISVVSADPASVPNAGDQKLLDYLIDAVAPFVSAALYGVATYEAVRAANLHKQGLSEYVTCYVGAGVHAAESRVSYSDWARLTRFASAIEARRAETVKLGSVHESAVAKPDAQPEVSQ